MALHPSAQAAESAKQVRTLKRWSCGKKPSDLLQLFYERRDVAFQVWKVIPSPTHVLQCPITPVTFRSANRANARGPACNTIKCEDGSD
eukprot:2716611-Rhodomonas_salina.3